MGEKIEIGEAVLPFSTDLTEYNKGLLEAKSGLSKFVGAGKEAVGVFTGLLATQAVAAVVTFVKTSVMEYAKLDKAIVRTSKTLEKLGYSFADARKHVEDYGDAIEATTQFSDEEAITSLQRLLKITQDLSAATQLNALAMDMVARDGGDLTDMAYNLGLAYNGNERGLMMLSRQLGVVGDKAKDAGYIFNLLEKRYRGAAKAADDLTTNFAKFGNALGNFGEKVGGDLAGPLNTLLKWATKLVLKIQELTKNVSYARVALTGLTSIGGVGILGFIAGKFLPKSAPSKAKAITPGNVDLAGQAGKNRQGIDAAENAEKARKKRLEEIKEITDEINAAEDEYLAKVEQMGQLFIGPVAQGMQGFFQEMYNGTKKLQDIWEALGKSIVKSMLNAMATVLEQKGAVALVEAMAALSNPITAITAPGYFAQAAAYATGAGGIRAVAANLAEGGIVMPKPGGHIVRVAEAGQAEAVIPLDKLSKMGMGGGIGTVHINLPNVKDGRDFQKPSTMRTAANMLLRETQRMKTRSGNAFSAI